MVSDHVNLKASRITREVGLWLFPPGVILVAFFLQCLGKDT